MEKIVLLKSDVMIFFSEIRAAAANVNAFDPGEMTDLFCDFAIKNNKVRKIPDNGGVLIMQKGCDMVKCPVLLHSLLV